MEPSELKELAINARIGHWPAHLGLNTDAERIDYLAQRLEEAAANVGDVEDLQDKLDAMVENQTTMQEVINDLTRRLEEKTNG